MLYVVDVYARIVMPEGQAEQVGGIYDVKALSRRHALQKGENLALKLAGNHYALGDSFGRDGKPYVKEYGSKILSNEGVERYCETRRKAV
jgi:hypothetical protein